ncbi:MAG: preprotein translocase subunit SecE [Micrococcus sp.]|nr:preprotein translocase subunit SecE [Micrococcus sp.]
MSSSQQASSSSEHGDRDRPGSRNPIAAIGLFLRQVVAELQKVVIPTRRELIVYTITVLTFVALMIFFVFGLDALFGWLAQAAFTSPDV